MQAIVQQIYHKSTQQRFALEEKHFTWKIEKEVEKAQKVLGLGIGTDLAYSHYFHIILPVHPSQPIEQLSPSEIKL
jgi:hypothetical protein